jgi:hypothetical protein
MSIMANVLVQDVDMLPPAPSGQSKKEKKAAAKILRKGVNVPLPQSDDADLIVQDHEQGSAPSGEESTSTTAGPPAVHETQVAVGDPMSLEHAENGEATEGHEPKVDQPETVDPDAPWPFIIHPFQDDSLVLYERVAAFDHFERQVKTGRQEWEEQTEKVPCGNCGKKHPPPCATRAQTASLRSALAEGRQIRKAWDVQGRRPPTEPYKEMLEGEVTMAFSHCGFTTIIAKTAFCSICAKYHPGGARECTAPFCAKGCNLNHPPTEACGAAVKRFANVKHLQGGGDGPSEEKKLVPAPSEAKATGGFDKAKFKTFYEAVGDDPDVLKSAAELFQDLTSKRPAEEPAVKPGSNKKGKKKQKAGGESSCQDPKPAPKGPKGPDGKGKAKAKRGGASSLNGTAFSLR